MIFEILRVKLYYIEFKENYKQNHKKKLLNFLLNFIQLQANCIFKISKILTASLAHS